MKRFSIEDLVKYLRLSVQIDNKENLDDENGLVEDSAYLGMDDEEILLILRVAVTRDFSEYAIAKIPEEAIYPITLTAKRDLYFKLATCAAPLFDLKADGAELKRDQRFQHYISLIQQIDKELSEWDNGGGSSRGTLSSFNVQLSNRYFTLYNQRTAVPPSVVLYVDSVGKDFVEVSWIPKLHTTDFSRYEIFLAEGADVFDMYSENKILPSAKLVGEVKDIWQVQYRISGLTPSTTYTVGVSVCANGGKRGYDSDKFETGAG